MAQSSNGTTQASQVLEGRGGVTLTLRGPSLSDSNMVHRSIQTPANGMPSQPGLVLINRDFLKYRYGVMPASATALSSSSTKGRRSRAHRQEQYPSLNRDDFRLFKTAPVKRKEIIDSIFFYSHVPTCQALMAVRKLSLDPEHYHAAYIFNRACDFLRKGKPEVFSAHEKALQFHYFRSQYHSGLCSTPPDTLTPQDIDRLRTAGFIKDEELDFIPALHLLALGVYARSSLLARFPIKEPSAVPIQMRWTVGADERPSLDEIHLYCESEEDKRRKRKGDITSFFGNARPRVTRKWEEYSLQNFGVYGLEYLKRPVMDSEVANLLTESDFTYINTKGPAVVEPDNLINFGSPALDTKTADIPDCAALPVELDFHTEYTEDIQSPTIRDPVETNSNADLESNEDFEELAVPDFEAGDRTASNHRSTTPESAADIGAQNSWTLGNVGSIRDSQVKSKLPYLKSDVGKRELILISETPFISSRKDAHRNKAEKARVDSQLTNNNSTEDQGVLESEQEDVTSFAQVKATTRNKSVKHTEPFSNEKQSTVEIQGNEENDSDDEHTTKNEKQTGRNTAPQTDDEDLEYILQLGTGASANSPSQNILLDHSTPISNAGSRKERKGGKSVEAHANSGNASKIQEVELPVPSCRRSERIRIRRLSVESIVFQTDDEKEELQIAEIACAEMASKNNKSGHGMKAQAAGTSKGAPAPGLEEEASESDDEGKARPADEANEETPQGTGPIEAGAESRAGKRKRVAEQGQENAETGPSVPRNKRTRPMPRGGKVTEATKTLPLPVSETISADIVSSASGVRRSIRLHKKGKKPAVEDASQQKPKPRKIQKNVNHGKSRTGANGKMKAKVITPAKKVPENKTGKPRNRKQTRKETRTDEDAAARTTDDFEQAITVENRPGLSREVDGEEEEVDEPQEGRYPLKQRRARGEKE